MHMTKELRFCNLNKGRWKHVFLQYPTSYHFQRTFTDSQTHFMALYLTLNNHKINDLNKINCSITTDFFAWQYTGKYTSVPDNRLTGIFIILQNMLQYKTHRNDTALWRHIIWSDYTYVAIVFTLSSTTFHLKLSRHNVTYRCTLIRSQYDLQNSIQEIIGPR